MSDRFDPAKDAANKTKHGLSLAFGNRIIEDENYLELPSIRPEDAEKRFKVIGLVNGRLFTAIFTWRDLQRRFISVRRSNNGEERAYRDPA